VKNDLIGLWWKRGHDKGRSVLMFFYSFCRMDRERPIIRKKELASNQN